MVKINRKLQRMQRFRKIRIILLKTIYDLLVQVQCKLQNSNQALKSLKKCGNWLPKCLKSLNRYYQHNEFKKLVLENHERDQNFKTYFARVKKIINEYAKGQSTCRITEHRLQDKNTFTKMLNDNIKVILIAIQILELFMTASKKRKFDNQLVETSDVKSRSCKSQSESLLDTQMPQSTFCVRQMAGGQSDTFSYEDTMQNIAGHLIDTLFDQKSDPWATITLKLRREHYERRERVWNELINEHNQLLLINNNCKISDIKEHLRKFYLINMQLALKNQISKPQKFEKVKWIKGSFSSTSSSKKKRIDTKDLAQSMHISFYETQLEKLKEEKLDLNKIYRLYSLIMSQELPSEQSDLGLLKEYENNPHYYNILMMLTSKESEQNRNLLNLFEHNFERIMLLIARNKRHERMLQMQDMNKETSMYLNKSLSNICASRAHQSVINEEYLNVMREKWVKYFAAQEKTPMKLHLEEIRRQKLLRQSMQEANNHKRQKLEEREKRLSMRSIKALYTAPRLTHRMRQAINRIAKEPLESRTPQQKIKNRISEPNEKSPNSSEEDRRPFIADVLLDSASWTSCCSKCQNLQNSNPSVPALRQFFSAQEQILEFGKLFR